MRGRNGTSQQLTPPPHPFTTSMIKIISHFFYLIVCLLQEDSYKLKSGYIRGHDQGFVDSISVFDNLVFAAMLRNPGALEDHISRVER